MDDYKENPSGIKRGRGRPKGSKNKGVSTHKSGAAKKGADTIAAIIRGGLISGKTPEQILAAVKKAFPQAKTSVATIHNYRSQLRAKGADIPTIRSSRTKKTATTTARSKKPTITGAIRKALLEGKSNDDTLAEVKKAFPDARTGRNTVIIQRTQLRKEGHAIPTSWEAKRAAQQTRAGSDKAARTLVIGGDHAGVELKAELKKHLKARGFASIDIGPDRKTSVDYPDPANAAAEVIAKGLAGRGILICGSGIGISIAANRHRHIRAALCTSGQMARLSRQHNDANVLVLGARLTGIDTAKDCLDAFLDTPFEGGRHQRRIDKMS